MTKRTYTRTEAIASDLADLGITQGRVKAWIGANPYRARNLRRALALASGGVFPPRVSGKPVPRLGAECLNSAAHDARITGVELLEEIAACEPVDGPIEALASEVQDWARMNGRAS